MLTIEIHDEELARQLRQIAESESRPVEEVLRAMVAYYPRPRPPKTTPPDRTEAVKRIRRKAYAKARQYWQSVGETLKAALTDDELDEQFGMFDEEGIPRLKSELTSPEPPVGSPAYAAKIAREANIHTAHPLDVTRADDILNNDPAI